MQWWHCSLNTHCLTKVCYLQIKTFQGNCYQSPLFYTETDDIILCNFACIAKYLFWSVRSWLIFKITGLIVLCYIQNFCFDLQRTAEAIQTILFTKTVEAAIETILFFTNVFWHECCLATFEIITKLSVYSFSQQIRAAVKIQSAFRGFSQRRRYRQQRDAAIILQRHFRFLQLARIKEENLRQRHNAAVYLQALWRGWLARRQASCLYMYE